MPDNILISFENKEIIANTNPIPYKLSKPSAIPKNTLKILNEQIRSAHEKNLGHANINYQFM